MNYFRPDVIALCFATGMIGALGGHWLQYREDAPKMAPAVAERDAIRNGSMFASEVNGYRAMQWFYPVVSPQLSLDRQAWDDAERIRLGARLRLAWEWPTYTGLVSALPAGTSSISAMPVSVCPIGWQCR